MDLSSQKNTSVIVAIKAIFQDRNSFDRKTKQLNSEALAIVTGERWDETDDSNPRVTKDQFCYLTFSLFEYCRETDFSSKIWRY